MTESHDNITRHTLLWLLITNIAVIMPLADKSSVATLGICGICFVWRIGIYFGRVARPPRWLVTTLAIAAAATLALVSRELGMLNALINLLILGYALKYIEMRERRDILAIVLAGFFLIALAFIDKQGIGDTLLSLLVIAINTATLLSVYRGQQNLILQARHAGVLLLQSLPLALALFIVLPRLSPLWLVPQSKGATTGLSDEVSFGDITQLTRSQELAFRVTFDGQPPATATLYWRALVLTDYDGHRWRQSEPTRSINWFRPYNIDERQDPPSENQLNYSVIAERSGQHWLFGLDRAQSQTKGVKQLNDYRLVSVKPIEQKFQYQVTSAIGAPLNRVPSRVELDQDLSVPAKLNPQTIALGKQYAAQYQNPRQRLAAMMQLFNQQPYYYTLTPPALGQNQLDEFLFTTRQGFCVHYASAFTILARASGLPARMVTGYQGGIYNADAGYMSVYQYMAHAWSEVWLPDSGWVRYDPTAMIAPERIEQGFDSMFAAEDSYLADATFSGIRNSSWFNAIRLQLANLDYYWTVWVLGFNEQRQQQLLSKLLGEATPLRIALFLGSVITLVMLIIAWHTGILRLPTRRSPIDSGFTKVANAAAKMGVERSISTGPNAFSEQLKQHWPALVTDIEQWRSCYSQLKYQQKNSSQISQLKKKFIFLSKSLSKKIRKSH
ncbi:hypothetical protein HR45_11475 [Shewanella mangrovi]|uniref:Transglutaminase-like domain-containing protein n=1 Tax=Shewanella mangrovi TaxID=1515746 RepID=A0A094JXY1_9GAMM|nr:DUF3488 and transglutaminase-like domain-containing protein [Shewanella mangrovi]KFZ37286.1 hypothetical protein HR45_11475 [Shewanella mangrovi]